MCGTEMISAQIKEDDLVCCDMGGTSFDMGVVFRGIAETKVTGTVKQWEYAISRYDIDSIGAGGGSIAWFDRSIGAIKIGPRSAGGNPGPACYGLGGTEPTVSDANLILGYLNPDIEIAGKKLNFKKAMETVGKLGEEIGRDAKEMAIGIFDLVNENMAGKVRSELIARGLDHRQFSLLCYGGAGPLHMTEIANLIGMKRSIVPRNASVFSANGLCLADIKCQDSKEVVYPEPWDVKAINDDFNEFQKRLIQKIRATGTDSKDIAVMRTFVMQFKGQFYSLKVAVATSQEITKEDLARAKEDFISTYARRYGEAALMPGAVVIIMSEGVECIGRTVNIELASEIETTKIPKDAIKAPRKMYSKKERGFVQANVYYGEKLLAGNKIAGPALIDFEHTTIRLGHGENVLIDQHLNFIV
jgi:N-methylhydantoinase A